MILNKLIEQNLIHPPKWLANNTCYLTIMGSVAYGVSNDTSDLDIYGCCIPVKEDAFPHLKGEIQGFGYQTKRFEQWQEHHIKYNNQEYDFQIFNIIKYFQLLMDNNPNVIDSIFTPTNCILHINQIGHIIRDNRRLFLHKGAWHRFKGYSYAQIHKLNHKQPSSEKRKETVEKHGYDTKYAMHLVRLLNEVEQILLEGDIDLQRNNEQLKSIRRGEWTLEQVRNYFTEKEKSLEELYTKSHLPYQPNEQKIKEILLQCLEIQYGNLSNVVNIENRYYNTIKEIQKLVNNI